MLIRCPACDHARQVNPDKVPAKAEFATCPKCGHRFRFRAVALTEDAPTAARPDDTAPPQDIWDAVNSLPKRWGETEDKKHDTETEGDTAQRPTTNNENDDRPTRDLGRFDDSQPWDGHSEANSSGGTPSFVIPWENPKRLGFVNSFFQTILMALLQPSRFFPAITANPPLPPALIFYILLGVLQYVCDMVWGHMVLSMGGPEMAAMLGPEIIKATDISRIPLGILMAPLALGIKLFVTTWVVHIIMRLLDPERASFARTFKIASYAGAAFTFSLIPILGPLIALFWYILLLLIGCKSAYAMPWNRALLLIFPLVMLLMLFIFNTMASFTPA